MTTFLSNKESEKNQVGWLPTKDYTENEKMPIEGLNPPWAFFLEIRQDYFRQGASLRMTCLFRENPKGFS